MYESLYSNDPWEQEGLAQYSQLERLGQMNVDNSFSFMKYFYHSCNM